MHLMNEVKKALRLVLAKAFEHYPHRVLLTGIFSATKGRKFTFEFAIAGEEKILLRKAVPPKEFLEAMVPALAAQFENHRGVKPAFIMEWLLDEEAIQQGAIALADEISRQISENAESQKTTPGNWMDIDYRFATLKWGDSNQ